MNTEWIIVTGASGGIGRNICELLSDMGYGVIMACRNMKKATPVFEDIRYITSNKNMRLMELDLASFDSIRCFTEKIKEKGYEVSTLVNNAGVLSHSYHSTADGYEQDWGVNYMGTYMLTRMLLPYMMSKCPKARVVNTVSVTARIGRIDDGLFDVNNRKFDRFRSYGTSKLGLLMFTKSMAEKYPADVLEVNAYDPGVVNTDMINMHPVVDTLSRLFYRPFLKSPMQAAKQAMDVIAPAEGTGSGYVYKGGKRYKIRKWAAKHPLKDHLWEYTERIFRERHGVEFPE